MIVRVHRARISALLSQFWVRCSLLGALMIGFFGAALVDIYGAAQGARAEEHALQRQRAEWTKAERDYLRLIATLARRDGVAAANADQILEEAATVIENIDATMPGDGKTAADSQLTWRQVVLLTAGGASAFVLLLVVMGRLRSDIEARRIAKIERLEAAVAHARFEDSIESLTEGFAIYDAEDRLVLCNNRQRQAHPHVPDVFQPGRKYAEIMRDILMTGTAEEALPEAEKTLKQMIELHRAKDGFFERRTKDGSWIRLSKRRTREGGVVTLRADITELKTHQQALAEQTALLQTILDNIGCGMSAYDQDFRLIAWNAQYLAINDVPAGFLRVGMPIDEVLGGNLAGRGPSDELARQVAVLRSGRSHQEVEERASGRIIELVVRPLPTGGCLSLHWDITERRQADRERQQLQVHLQHSQRIEALGTLAGGIAHDLNNCLVPVLSVTKLLMRKMPLDENARHSLELVHQGANRARDLVKQILAFSRKEASTRELFNLDAVVNEALNMLRATVPTTIRLEAEVEAAGSMLGDSGQLYQVVVNLITNAAQAIGDGAGAIYVGLHEEVGSELPSAPYLHLSIRDTGCGIPEDVLARIFEPFFTTKAVGKGTGLGLSVVHGIVTAHDGKITVRSRPGEGTQFDVYLPLASAESDGEHAMPALAATA